MVSEEYKKKPWSYYLIALYSLVCVIKIFRSLYDFLKSGIVVPHMNKENVYHYN